MPYFEWTRIPLIREREYFKRNFYMLFFVTGSYKISKIQIYYICAHINVFMYIYSNKTYNFSSSNLSSERSVCVMEKG